MTVGVVGEQTFGLGNGNQAVVSGKKCQRRRLGMDELRLHPQRRGQFHSIVRTQRMPGDQFSCGLGQCPVQFGHLVLHIQVGSHIEATRWWSEQPCRNQGTDSRLSLIFHRLFWQNLEPHHLAFLQVQRTQRAQPGVPTKGPGHYPA